MRTESLDFISLLQRDPKNIRNICILAHVDHGKTTIADCLISSNGIISARLAGKLRYMDSREDEQKRGITMKSSAISLHHVSGTDNFLVNLIDSPGHIDFSSEVSTAIRLCDGALVVVDVVEGVCPQTHAVLKQAWLEGIKPCLVLNKIDRLITELKLSPQEAYDQLEKVLGQVNAVTGTLFSAQVMEQSTKLNPVVNDDDNEQVFDWSSGLDEADDENLYFAPAQGNVVFASAADGWAFGIESFADMYSTKLGISRHVLMKTLWGDYYLNMKAKKILKGAHAKGKKPLFVQFIVDNIWNVYHAVLINRDKEKIEKIVSSLNLKVSARDSKGVDAKVHLQAIMRQWLPLSDSILKMVSDVLPSPLEIKEERVKNLMCGGFKNFDSFPEATRLLKEDFLKCSSSEDAPVIVFVSKMFSVPSDALPHNRRRPLTKEELALRHEAAKQRLAEREKEKNDTVSKSDDQVDVCTKPLEIENSQENMDVQVNKTEESMTEKDAEPDQCFVAFARVFSGTVKKGSKLFVLGPKYQPETSVLKKGNEDSGCDVDSDMVNLKEHMSVCQIEDLYLMMGREFEEQEFVPAGNVLAIKGLADHVLKSATVSTTRSCPPFTPMPLAAKPIVRVAVEPKLPSQLPSLVAGMKLLNQADPCVQVLVQESGEYVIVAAGEVHLQRCLDDLRERYAKIPLNASDPIVPFRETVVVPPKIDMVNEEVSDINRSTTHHSQRLPTFMLKEIQSYSNVFKVDELEDTLIETEIRLTKTQISELRKTEKLKEKLGLIEAFTSNKEYCLILHAKPIPMEVLTLLESHDRVLRIIQEVCATKEKTTVIDSLSDEIIDDIKNFYDKLKSQFQELPKLWKNCVDKIWSIGPKGVNNNILINNIKDYDRPNIWEGLVGDFPLSGKSMREYDNSVITGFQLAAQAGPICEEPLMGVAFFVEDWKHVENAPSACPDDDSTTVTQKTYGPISGQHISAAKEACRRAIMCQPMRIMAAMYTCDIQATSEVLGKVYGVLGKREGKVMSEELQEGSDIFDVKAELPVAESFGFAEEIRKKTSGLASPQLVFSRWHALDVDPFWIPTTEEEYELYGEKADSDNLALKYVNNVRRRKGLYVEEKTVEHAEKQRTLKKNK